MTQHLNVFSNSTVATNVLDEIVLTHEELKEAGGPVDASKRAVAVLAGKKAWRTVHNWEHGERRLACMCPRGARRSVTLTQ